MKHEHLLVIRFSALGDVAMTVPIIWALARQYPDMRITVLSRPSSRPFFEDLAPNVNFMGADIKGEYHGMSGLNALYRRLKAKQFTAIADLHNVLRSEYLRLRFNLGFFRVEHIDKHRSLRRKLTKSKNKNILSPLPTSFENYIDVFRRLGYPINPETLCFKSIFAEKGNLNMLPKDFGPKLNWEQWIGVAPFAAHKGKIYPEEKMQSVVSQLISQHPKCRIFLFGRGQQEEQVFAKWTSQMPQCTFVGKHVENMYQELILMSHLDVMVSMDSANMHMASLTGTPVVSIWGATHPKAGFMGWGQSLDHAVQVNLDCRPCSIYGNKPCRRGDYACLNLIQPETIVEKINEVLTKNQTKQ
jgi:ADP-heptose:LPS heptosyltransferase